MLNHLLAQILRIHFAGSYCVALITRNGDFATQNFATGSTPILITGSNGLLPALNLGCDGVIFENGDAAESLDILRTATKKSVQRKCRNVIVLVENSTWSLEALKLPVLDYFPNFVLGVTESLDKSAFFWRQKYSGYRKQEQQLPVLVDFWTNGSFELGHSFFPENWKNMNGRQLKMATFHYPPYSIIEGDYWDGTEMKFAMELAKQMNFTWNLVTDSFQWGEIYENSSGNGILGNVASDAADFGFGALYLWYHEYQFIDFTVPYIRTGITCLAPRPKPLSGLTAPALPFSRGVWAAVGATVAAGALLLWLLHRRLGRPGRPLECAIDMAGMMLAVPVHGIHPGAVRFCLNCFLFQGLLLATCYSSSLVSFMTVPRFEAPIDTAAQLAKRDFSWAASHDAWAFSLREATDPVSSKVYKLFKVMTEEDQLQATLKGARVAFAVERLPSGQLAANQKLAVVTDKLRLMQQDLYWEMVVSVVAKGSALTSPANRLALRLIESGLLLHWEALAARQWDQAALRHSHEVRGPQALALTHLAGVFVILAAALALSASVLVIEILMSRKI